MKKSLLITYFFPPEIGGIQNYLYHLCDGIEAGKIAVLANQRGEDSLNFDQKQKFKIYRKNFLSPKFFKLWNIFLFLEVLRIIKKEKIEFLQFGHYHQFCLTGFICKILFNLPYLIYFHGVDLSIVKNNKMKILLFKIIAKKAEFLIANSDFVKIELIKLGAREKKIKIITPAVNAEKFDLSAKNDWLIKKYNLLNKRIILSIGRLTRIKGFDLVIKAMPRILKEIPNLVYLIIGNAIESNYKKELEKLITEFNLDKKVIFLGKIEDKEEIKSRYYNLAELVIMPSREIKHKNYSHIESFGIAALEAQAMKKPVVASAYGGLKESVLDGQTGVLFDPENIDRLSFIIIKLLKDENLILKMGLKGRERMEKEFSWSDRLKRFSHIINI
ncbi:MAG: phosphatidylinositol alpha-1,6-mannosyltransferase [Parcubacteria group bacterium Athens1014_10]|nr:MAG: phosphatidylinositol alpha-1,6-mannosyltransferase [Parcubacteria group bacterium Athens1014_10]TSD06050.1 MAG: phosphatidylinositol alpha-1,6-mannosyltransferase [Parcubacteria group bacterium Athens0714_12]